MNDMIYYLLMVGKKRFGYFGFTHIYTHQRMELFFFSLGEGKNIDWDIGSREDTLFLA